MAPRSLNVQLLDNPVKKKKKKKKRQQPRRLNGSFQGFTSNVCPKSAFQSRCTLSYSCSTAEKPVTLNKYVFAPVQEGFKVNASSIRLLSELSAKVSQHVAPV